MMTVMLLFGKKFPVENGTVRRCVVMMQQSIILSPKSGAKCWHIFKQSSYNVTVVGGIDCLACQDEFFANNALDVKESDEHALEFAH
jgi:hypothetical protein